MENVSINTSQFKNLKFEYNKGEYMAILVDDYDYEIIKGYGASIIEAINDLHHSLL